MASVRADVVSSVGDGRRGLLTAAVAAGYAGWFWLTVASSHPTRHFDRARGLDRMAVAIPNWRFFAPNPAQHDFHVLHRELTHDGRQTDWKDTVPPPPRTWRQMLWFPTRRRGKAMFDVNGELLSLMHKPGVDIRQTVPYRLLQSVVEAVVRAEYADRELPRGFQFLILRYTGHDEENEPEYFIVSAFVPLQPLRLAEAA